MLSAMKTLLLAAVALAIVHIAHAGPHRAAEIALSYEKFDQTPDSGWRVLAAKKQYREAAQLIGEYLSANSELPRDQQAILHFHAAQVLAFAGETESALKHLESASLHPEPAGSPVRWNDYVAATKAFLGGDRPALLAARERIASGPAADGEIPNLAIVDSLIARFGEPYEKAYQRR